MGTVAENLHAIKAKIGKINQHTQIIAVSKNHDVNAVMEAINSGQFLFGENRVQEAAGKFPELKKQFPNLKLHLIGPLQTNKVKDALALFDVIQTLDREKLALAIAKEIGDWRLGNGKKSPISNLQSQEFFIQVNIGNEAQKAGIAHKLTKKFYNFCTKDLKLNVTGLMCIPPVDEAPEIYFKQLINLKSTIPNLKLSMGMSNDYEIASNLNADFVRIGTAIFGERPY